MKSISRLTALLVLFTLFLSACGGAAAPPAATPTAAPAAAEATAAPAAAEATAAPAAEAPLTSAEQPAASSDSGIAAPAPIIAPAGIP